MRHTPGRMNFSLQMDEKLHARLQRAAGLESESMAEVARRGIERAVEEIEAAAMPPKRPGTARRKRK